MIYLADGASARRGSTTTAAALCSSFQFTTEQASRDRMDFDASLDQVDLCATDDLKMTRRKNSTALLRLATTAINANWQDHRLFWISAPGGSHRCRCNSDSDRVTVPRRIGAEESRPRSGTGSPDWLRPTGAR